MNPIVLANNLRKISDGSSSVLHGCCMLVFQNNSVILIDLKRDSLLVETDKRIVSVVSDLMILANTLFFVKSVVVQHCVVVIVSLIFSDIMLLL